MSVICLFFPRLAVEIVRQRNSRLRGKPIVIVDGHGEEARVTHRSPEAACEGVVVGMKAGQARRASHRSAFFAAPTSIATAALEDLARTVSEELGCPVVAAGDDALVVEFALSGGLSRGLEAYALQLAQAIARESGYAITAALGGDAAEAVANARVAARRVVTAAA